MTAYLPMHTKQHAFAGKTETKGVSLWRHLVVKIEISKRSCPYISKP